MTDDRGVALTRAALTARLLSEREGESAELRGRNEAETTPRSESDRPCTCPPGWRHQPDCHEVTG